MAQGKPKDERAKMMIYPNWADTLMAAPGEYCKKLFTAMWEYRNGTPYEELDMDPITAALFAGMKVQMDLDMQNYAETKARNQENGRRKTISSQQEPDACQQEPDAAADAPVAAECVQCAPTDTQMNPAGASGIPDEPKRTQMNPVGASGIPNEPKRTQMNPAGASGIPDEPKTTQSGGVKDKDKDKDKVKDKDKDNHSSACGGTLDSFLGARPPDVKPVSSPEPSSDASKPKQTAKPILSKAQLARFDRWYAEYPKKANKGAALRAWKKLDPDDDLTNRMISAVSHQKQVDYRFRGDPRYRPDPATWLNGMQWENEYTVEPASIHRRRENDIYHDYSQELAEIEAHDRATGWTSECSG